MMELYIPFVQKEVSCESIAARFAAQGLGHVSRIEWNTQPQHPGYKECFVFINDTTVVL
jgi:hypothetical protein